jgi:sterol desaturase/sphingolipid hydroxylase (fatty acid hydroxylase superfamily)
VGPNLIALAIPLFFVLIAIELIVARVKKRSVYRLADALGDLGCGVGQQMGSLLFSGLLLAGYSAVFEHARLFTLPAWAQWVLAFVGVDFLYYWWHRLSHEVNILWAAHVVHHQSEDYNLAVALRQSITTSFTSFPFFVVLSFLGVGIVPLLVANNLSTLYQFWIHTELVPPLKHYELVFNGPSAHRVHHGTNPPYLDKNHGGTLIIWDRLFGTYAPETEPVVYGITKPLSSFNAVWAQFAGYADLVMLARKAPNAWQALQVFFRSPAWHPDWAGDKPVPAPQVKYEVLPGPWARRYAFGWFAPVVVATFCLSMWGKSLELPQAALCAGLVFLTLLGVAGVLEGRRWVRVLEPLRVVALLSLPLWVFAAR